MASPKEVLSKALGKEPRKPSEMPKYTNSKGEATTPVKEIDKMRNKKETFSEKNGKKPMSAIQKKRSAEKAILDSL